jgi:hypothetical protein
MTKSSILPETKNVMIAAQFRADTSHFLGALALPGLCAAAAEPKRLKVAAVFTEFTFRSHAHVILENFLESRRGGRSSRIQRPKGDLADELAKGLQDPDLQDDRRGALSRRQGS